MASLLSKSLEFGTSPTATFKKVVSWEDTLTVYLTKESPVTKRRLKLKILDTVFLLPPPAGSTTATNSNKPSSSLPSVTIKFSSWIYTSKRGGEVAKRNDIETLELRHVCERFGRFALSNPANARGSRFVAVAYLDAAGDKKSQQNHLFTATKSLITAENFKLAIQGNPYEVEHIENTLVTLRKAKYLQCYLHPQGGEDTIFRAIVRTTTPAEELNNFSSSAFVLEQIEEGGREEQKYEDDEDADPLDFSYVYIPVANSKVTYRIGLFACQAANSNCTTTTATDTECNMDTKPILFSKWKEGGKKPDVDCVRDLIGTATEKLIRHITSFPFDTPFCTQYSHTLVEHMIVDYIFDENKQLWLSSIPSMYINYSGSETQMESSLLESKKKTRFTRFTTSNDVPTDTSRKIDSDPIIPLSEMNNTSSTPEERRSTLSPNQKEQKIISPSSSSCQPVNHSMNVSEKDSTISRRQSAPTEEDAATQTLNESSLGVIQCDEMKSKQNSSEAKDRYFHQELIKLKKDVVKKMQHKEEEHRLALLEVQSQLSFFKAECSSLKSKLKQSGNDVNTDEELPKDNAIGGHLFLLEKLHQLHQEITACQRKWGEEKRSIMSAHAAAQQELMAQHRLELSQLRSVVAASEDEIISQNNLCRELEKERASLLNQLDESGKKLFEMSLLIENMRKESEIHLMNQSKQAVANMGMAANSCVSRLEISFENSKSTNEPAIRSLVNKLEYMKAQLESEATLKDDYMATIELLRSEKDTLLSAHQERLRALEDQKNKEISLIRQQLSGANEVALKEISILKEQVGDLQVKLGDAVRGLARAQHREALARREAENEEVALELAREELSNVRNELDTCQKALNQNDSSSNAAINEAILRRAENERRYLTTQIESELAFKKELIEKLSVTEQKLLETTNFWKNETQLLREKLLAETSSRASIESELKGKNNQLLSEVEVHHRQIEDLKQVYTKTREQFRIEQVTTDQLRATNQRLLEELHAAQDELVHAKQVTEETIARHTETTRLISTSIEMADETCAKKIEKLQEEAKAALNEASTAKLEMLQLQTKNMERRGQLLRSCGAHVMLSSLHGIIKKKKQRLLSLWICKAAELRLTTFYQKTIEHVSGEVEVKTVLKFECLLLSTMKQVMSERETEVIALKGLLDGNKKIDKDPILNQYQKSLVAEEKVKSDDGEICTNAWHETSRRLRKILEKVEEDREYAVASILKEEALKRNHALQVAAAENAKLLEQVKNNHLVDLEAQIKRAVEEAQKEEEIVKRCLKEDIYELKSALIKIKSEAKAEVDFMKAAANTRLEKYRAEFEANADLERQSWNQRLTETLNAQAVKSSSEMEKVLETAELQFLERMDNALAELQKACELEKASDIRHTREDYEAKLLELKQTILNIQEEKRLLEKKVSEAVSNAEESNDTIFDLRQATEMLSVQFSFHRLRFVAAGLKHHARYAEEMKSKDDALRDALEATRVDFESKMRALFEQIHTLENIVALYKNLQLQMNDTLVNYKREFLQEHQSKSKSVASKLQSISIKQEELENRRIALKEQMKVTEEKLRSLEQEMGEHSKISTLQGGRINVAHAKKKRRMNEEFENLIDDIESKKEEQSVIDENIRELIFQKDETDCMMKTLERALVEVLVEQQKRMLDILSKFSSALM
jgi:hypothetical protein